MTTTGVILQSGRFTASPDQLRAALDAHKKKLEEMADELGLTLDELSRLMLLTEMSPGKYDKVLIDWAKDNDFHLHHPKASGPDECAILSQRPFARQTYLELTRMRLDPKVTNRTAPLFVTAARPKSDAWFGVWHSPAHNNGLRAGNQATRVYRSALGGLKRWRHGVFGAPTIGGDFNADPRRRHVLSVLLERFPRMRWAGPQDQKATQGGRVIDGFLTRRRVVEEAKTLPAQPGFDHRPVSVVLG